MNNRKLIVGFAAFAVSLWLVVVTTYAAQAKREDGGLKPRTMVEGTSCSSSGSSSGSE